MKAELAALPEQRCTWGLFVPVCSHRLAHALERVNTCGSLGSLRARAGSLSLVHPRRSVLQNSLRTNGPRSNARSGRDSASASGPRISTRSLQRTKAGEMHAATDDPYHRSALHA